MVDTKRSDHYADDYYCMIHLLRRTSRMLFQMENTLFILYFSTGKLKRPSPQGKTSVAHAASNNRRHKECAATSDTKQIFFFPSPERSKSKTASSGPECDKH